VTRLSLVADETVLFGPADLPPLTSEEIAHVAALHHRLRDLVRDAGGVLPFPRFMEEALYGEELGYYTGRRSVFGSAGDYTTASDESDAYAALFAHKAKGLFASGLAPAVLEIGPGTGRFAADFVRELTLHGVALSAYHLLEPHPRCEAQQRALLGAGEQGPFRWCRQAPAEFRGLVLAHEIFDAQPCARFARTTEEFCAWGLGVNGDRLGWRLVPADPVLVAELAAIERDLGGPFSAPYVSEALMDYGRVLALLDAVAEAFFLVVDYGHPRRTFYHPERRTGTLRCHYRHRVHDDPLHAPGVEDITAHVDFTRLAILAEARGWSVEGFDSLGEFAVAGGSFEAVATSAARRRALARLTDPATAGEVFKVLALARGEVPLGPTRVGRDRIGTL
jgi:SAM-dependent MidA family methyltransferase